MTKGIDLSVVIVNHNTKDLLRSCLQSLDQHAIKTGMEVWVVDNASDDGSVEMLQADFAHVHLISNRENVGFAPANNQALARAVGRYCLLLNSDTIVLPGTLEQLVQFMDETPEAGVAGCAQIYPDGRLQVTCHRRISLGRELVIALGLGRLFSGLLDHHLPREGSPLPRRVDWVEGGALLIRATTLAAVGSLDAAYFMYVEDADFCLRVRQTGWDVYYVPGPKIVHTRGQSTGLEQRGWRQMRVNPDLLVMQRSSTAYYFRKHHGLWQERAYRILSCIYGLRKLLMSLGLYLLRMMSRDNLRSASEAYLTLMRAKWA